jgi:poly(hydroxyalkanoate) granule-associated protein
MVKKTSSSSNSSTDKAPKGAAGLQGSQLAGAVKDSAQHIWLAGMGAFSKAQAEGGKVFEALVREGQNLQRKTQGLAEDRISEVTGKMSAMADTVTAKAGQNWDKLESIFEARTAKAMTKLGVPTAKDVDALVQRVDELAAAVARLSQAGPAAKAPAEKAAAKKAAANQATVKKAVAKKAVASKPMSTQARAPRKTARTA